MAPSRSLGSRAGPRPGSRANPTLASPARCHTGLGHTGLAGGWMGWTPSMGQRGCRMVLGLCSLQGEGAGVPRARSQPLKN